MDPGGSTSGFLFCFQHQHHHLAAHFPPHTCVEDPLDRRAVRKNRTDEELVWKYTPLVGWNNNNNTFFFWIQFTLSLAFVCDCSFPVTAIL